MPARPTGDAETRVRGLRRLEVLPLLLLAATAFWFVSASSFSASGFPLDDAWIHRVYARALASGQGFAYNAGEQQVGVTSPLWVLVSAPVHVLEGWGAAAVAGGVKAVGVALAAACVLLLAALTRDLAQARHAGVLGAALLALEPRLLFEALSGMENTLVLALWLAAAFAIGRGRRLVGAVGLGLLPLARPEALLVLPLGALALLLAGWGRRAPGPLVGLVAVLGLPSLLWAGYCQLVSGHWLPTPFYVKSQPAALEAATLPLLASALGQHGWSATPAFVLGLVGLAVVLGRRRDRVSATTALLLLLAPIVVLLGVVMTRPVALHGYYWMRWLAPPILVLTAAACAGLAGLALSLRHPSGQRTWGRRIAGALALVIFLLSLPALVTSARERRLRLASDSRAIHLLNVRAGLWIREHLPPDAVVGVNDAGALRYFGERRTRDLVGLNDAEVAFGRIGPDALLARLDWLAVFPDFVEQRGWSARFEVRQTFAIPEEEYTVCACPMQSTLVVARRREDGPS